MKDLPKKLRIKASMIELGERIAWGSEAVLMKEAANKIEELEAELAALKSAPVVMPDRRHIDSLFRLYKHDLGWNACLDEFARLNGGKP